MKSIYLSFILLIVPLFGEIEIYQETKEIIKNLKNTNQKDIFLGKYHFSTQNLLQMGLIESLNFKQSTYIDYSNHRQTIYWRNALNENKFLDNPSNWTIKGGKKTFLDSEPLQEETMDRLLKQNFEALLQKGLDMKNPTSSKALLVASHFGDVQNAYRYALENIDTTTQKAIKISSYFKIGAGGENLAMEARKFLGKRYIWGGTNPNIGADCSGYVQYIYKRSGLNLPRTALQQSRYGKNISIDALQKGDLLFFNTDLKRNISVTHVGIYLENSNFIHSASTKKGVIISPLNKYKKVFVKASRLIESQKISKVSKLINEPQAKKLSLAIDELLKNAPPPTLFDATMATSKLDMHYDPLVIENGLYVHKSQLTN